MPSYQTARQVASNALSKIGAWPSSQSQPDERELKIAMGWLEMLLNNQSGIRPTAGFWNVIEIPIEATIGDYDLADYVKDVSVQHVFSVSMVTILGNVEPLTIISEKDTVFKNLKENGTPHSAAITRDVKPILKVYPNPTSSDEDAGSVIRIRVQSFHSTIDPEGTNETNIMLRPSWYLWLAYRLAYEIGGGPVRRLPESELTRIQRDYQLMETQLYARDGQYNTSQPPITRPVEGSMY